MRTLIAWLLLVSFSQAATYYVDVATGSNGDTGLSEALAWADPGYASTQMGDGDICYVKAGTYTVTTTTVGAAGPVKFASASLRARMEGYSTTPGDRCVGGSLPLIQASSSLNPGSTCYLVEAVGTINEPHHFISLNVDANNEPNTICCKGVSTATAAYSFFIRCIAQRASSHGFSSANVEQCYATGNGGNGFEAVIPSFCHAEANTGIGIACASQATRCAAKGNGGGGIDLGFGPSGINLVAVGNTGWGIRGQRSNKITASVSISNTTYGYQVADHVSLETCASFGNTTARSSTTAMYDYNPITLTGDPFVDAANDDFTPDDTANEGALLRAAGVNLYGHAGYLDVGAVQHEDPEGGGGGGTDQITIVPFYGSDIQEDSGDYPFEFNVYQNGIPFALVSGAVQGSLDGGTDAATGLTLNTIATGRYEVVVDSDSAAFNGGGNLALTLSAGTVDGNSVANAKVGEVSVGRYASAPTNFDQLDVDGDGRITIQDGTGPGQIDTNGGAIVAVTTVAGFGTNALTAAALAADAVTEIWASTGTDPTSIPGATGSRGAKIDWLFAIETNRKRVTQALIEWYAADGTTVIGEAALNPNNSTEVDQAETAAP